MVVYAILYAWLHAFLTPALDGSGKLHAPSTSSLDKVGAPIQTEQETGRPPNLVLTLCIGEKSLAPAKKRHTTSRFSSN